VKDEERAHLTIDEVKQLYGSSQSLLQLISCTMQDAACILRLMCELNVLPLALQITKIAGKSYFMNNIASEIWCFHSVKNDLGFNSQQGQDIFLFYKSFRLALVPPPTLPPIQWV
jgi:hypothetical protein